MDKVFRERKPYLFFDGVDDYGEIPDAPNFNINSLSAVTFSIKFLIRSYGSAGRLYDKSDGASPTTGYYLYTSGAGSVGGDYSINSRIVYNGGSIGLSSGVSFGFPFKYNTIYTVHVVYNDISGKAKIYVNGILSVISAASITLPFIDTHPYLRIGNAPTISRPLNGNIYDFKMYNKALSESEVFLDFNGQIQSGKILDFDLTERYGNALDKVNSNVASIVGAIWL